MPRWNDEDRSALALIRYNAGYTIETAAVAMGMTSRTLARYENGVNDIPMSIAEKMATTYKVPFDAIREAVSKVRDAALLKAAIEGAGKGEE